MYYTKATKTSLVLFLVLPLAVSLLAQPISDNCDGLIDLGIAPVCTGDIYTNVDATLSEVYTNPTFNIPSCWSIVNHDVWAGFTVPSDGSVVDFIISIIGNENGTNATAILQPRVALYRGSCQQDGLAELFCAEAVAGANEIQLVTEGLTPGLTYFLRIDDQINTASPNWGDFEICIEELILDVEALVTNDTICAGSPIDLMANITGEFDDILWSPENFFVDPTVAAPILSGSGTLFQTTTFTVEVTAGSLTDTDEIIVYVSNPEASISPITDATCTGICNGTATATVTGSISPEEDISYLWSNGESSASISGLCAGNYTVTITDGIGCTSIATTTINEAIFSVSAIPTTDPCSSEATGSAAVLVLTGGTAPFTYAWSNGDTTANIDNLAAGTYEVAVTDINGCNASASVNIAINPAYAPNITASADAICPGQEVTLTAPTPPAGTMLSWSTGETSTSITVNPMQTATYSLNSSAISQNIIRNGDFENGDAEFTTQYIPGSGGAWGILSVEGSYAVNVNSANVHSNFPPCTDFSGIGNMLIVNGSNEADAQIWCQTVTVAPNTDYLFATSGMTIIAENPAILQFSISNELLGTPFTLSSIPCEWNNFNETWNSGNSTSVDICIVNQNLFESGNDFALDNISLTPICNNFDEISITVSTLETSITNQTNANCQGEAGTAFIQATGDLEPFTYLWDNGETNAQAVQLGAGIHQVTVSNSIGCESILSVDIEQDAQLEATIVAQTNVSCQGEAGTALVEVSGNTEPFTYLWDNGETTAMAVQLNAGIHQVTVSNSIGCESIVSVDIGQDSQISIDSLIVTEPLCGEIVDGESIIIPASIFVDNFDGNTPFLYRINGSDFQESNSFENLEAGEYEVTVQDADGCMTSATTTISALVFPPEPELVMSTEDLCNVNALVEIGVANADDYALISWSTGEEEAIIFVNEAGTYEVTVFSEDNCSTTADLSLTDCAKYEIPNVFSPNSDGINDVFKIYSAGNGFEFISLKIFNRWGQIAFETATNEPWDGNVNGKPAPSDIFIYQAVVKLNGETKEERGSVTLVR